MVIVEWRGCGLFSSRTIVVMIWAYCPSLTKVITALADGATMADYPGPCDTLVAAQGFIGSCDFFGPIAALENVNLFRGVSNSQASQYFLRAKILLGG